MIKLANSKVINTPVRLRIARGPWCFVWQVWHKDKLTGSGQFEWGTFAYVFAVPPNRALDSALSYLAMRGISA